MLELLTRTRAAAGAVAIALAVGLAAPAASQAHGGTTIADGQKDGVTVRVQGSDAATAGGAAVDIATTLAGPGSGKGSSVTYYLRTAAGKKSIRVETERDEGGVHHAEISTGNRGDWRDWDVSAVVTLSNDERLRVSNAGSDAPGPDPAQSAAASADETSETPVPTSPTATESTAPSTPATSPATEDSAADNVTEDAVDDISGEKDDAPGWVLPSIAAILVLGLGSMALLQRRRSARDAGGDGNDAW